MTTSLRILLLVAGVLLAGCTQSPAPSPTTAPPSTDGRPDADGTLEIVEGTASGPGISIDEALQQASTVTGPLLVNGSLFVDPDGTVLLCSAMAESFPPQCGGSRLLVGGLDLDGLADAQEANGVRWVDQVQLLGLVSASGS